MKTVRRLALATGWCLVCVVVPQMALCADGEPASAPAAKRRARMAAREVKDRQRTIANLRAVLEDPNATPYNKADTIGIIGAEDLREFKPQVERLAREDPSELVRKNAKRTLEFWQFRDAEVAERERQAAEIRRRAALTPEQRRQEQDELERKAVVAMRDHVLRMLQSEKLEDRREIMGGAHTWARHLPEARLILLNMVRSDSDSGLRMYALLALVRARPDSPETLELLRSCLGPENPLPVRDAAASQICEWGEKAGLDVLIGHLSASNVHYLAHTMKVLRGAASKGDIGPPASLLTKAEMPKAELTEDEKRQIREGAAAWQKWWKEERETFVMPRRKTTRASSRPTTGPGR